MELNSSVLNPLESQVILQCKAGGGLNERFYRQGF
jgi:hypothetical protein